MSKLRLAHPLRAVAAALVAAGCAQVPADPGGRVMPAPDKPFEVFASEDRECRELAESHLGLTDAEMTAHVGAHAPQWASWDPQRRYDWSYGQCMYANGNQVPGFAGVTVPAPKQPPQR